MLDKKPIYTTIRVTDKTQTQKLPIIDQLRLLLGKVSTDETVRLEASEKVSRETIKMESALSSLVDTVTARMRELGHTSVTISVSSRFKPYFETVLSPVDGKGRFYDFEIQDKGASIIGADYFIIMKIKEKEEV